MKTRIAKKILKPDLLHFYWYGSGLWSLAPRNPQRYFKANKVLHKKPYYSREWLTLIYTVFGKPKKNGNIYPYESFVKHADEILVAVEEQERIVEQVNSCETAMCAKISGEHLVAILDEMKERHGTMDR